MVFGSGSGDGRLVLSGLFLNTPAFKAGREGGGAKNALLRDDR